MVSPTGRVTQSGPSVQNVPVRTDEGRAIREAFTGQLGSVTGRWTSNEANFEEQPPNEAQMKRNKL